MRKCGGLLLVAGAVAKAYLLPTTHMIGVLSFVFLVLISFHSPKPKPNKFH